MCLTYHAAKWFSTTLWCRKELRRVELFRKATSIVSRRSYNVMIVPVYAEHCGSAFEVVFSMVTERSANYYNRGIRFGHSLSERHCGLHVLLIVCRSY